MKDHQSLADVEHGTVELPTTEHCVHPVDGARCVLNLAADLDIQYPVGDNVTLELGEGDSILADLVDKQLFQMKAGESSEIAIPATDVNSRSDTVERVGAKQGLIKIELKSFANIPSIYKMSSRDKFNIALHHKTKGVELHKLGNTVYSFRRFSKSLKYLILMLPRSGIDASVLSDYDRLQVQCYANMAVCQLAFDNFEHAVQNCSKALDIDAGNFKCLYRRGESYFRLGELAKAKSDAMKGLKIEPKSKAFCELLKRITYTKSK